MLYSNRTPILLAMLFVVVFCLAQEKSPGSSTKTLLPGVEVQLPTVVRLSGTLNGFNSRTEASPLAMTFKLYENRTGGTPLWTETQSVWIESDGSYTALLGGASSEGLPTDLFPSMVARWLAVQVAGHDEQRRLMVVRAPGQYGLEAADAKTADGMPLVSLTPRTTGIGASTIVDQGVGAFIPPPPPPAFYTVEKFVSPTEVGNSVISQDPTTSAIGIATTAPTRMLDVAGNIGVVGTGSGVVFPDGTKLTSVNVPMSKPFAICISNSPTVPSCSCAHILAATSVRNGGSCTTAGASNVCSAASNPDPRPGGVNGTSGVCCVCD